MNEQKVAVLIKKEEMVMEEYEGLNSIKGSWKSFFINLTIGTVTVLLVGLGIRYAHGITEKEESQKKIKVEQTNSNVNNTEEKVAKELNKDR
ncbi:hypothetical protein [Bacillus cereus]|nr:hypothetical protein [Bacillus cereus]